jgi:hypothetical protein
MEVSGQLHAPAALSPERIPGTNWIGGWVGPRAGLEAVVERKIPSPIRGLNPVRPARSLVVIPTELPRLLSVKVRFNKGGWLSNGFALCWRMETFSVKKVAGDGDYFGAPLYCWEVKGSEGCSVRVSQLGQVPRDEYKTVVGQGAACGGWYVQNYVVQCSICNRRGRLFC